MDLRIQVAIEVMEEQLPGSVATALREYIDGCIAYAARGGTALERRVYEIVLGLRDVEREHGHTPTDSLGNPL